jgi:transposase InsO family protein
MHVERVTNKLLRCIIIDNGGGYCSKAFKEYCSKPGIKHVKTIPHTPQQNGTTKRMNQIVMDKVRSILSNYSLPKYFWVEVVHTTH